MSLVFYLPVLLFILMSIGFCSILLLVGKKLGAHSPNSEKNAPFECGFPPFEDARKTFSIQYSLIAILFVIFDIEIAFLFPWGISLRLLRWPSFIAMLFFLMEFMLAYIYLYRHGALDWQ